MIALSAGGCGAATTEGGGTAQSAVQAQSQAEPLIIEHNGVQLAAVLEVPTQREGEQMPLAIIMHGLGGDKEAPIHQALSRAFIERGFATLRFDFNGHGASSGEFSAMTIPGEIDDARAVLAYASDLDFVTDISLVGHSQGGVVASILAGTTDEEISSVVLLAPAYGIDQAAREGVFIGQTYDPADPPESLPLPWGGLTIGRDYLVTTQDLQIGRDAKKFTGPVLIIQGDADEVLLASGAEEFAEVFPDGRIRIENGQDHNFSKDPAQIAQIAADFLQENHS